MDPTKTPLDECALEIMVSDTEANVHALIRVQGLGGKLISTDQQRKCEILSAEIY